MPNTGLDDHRLDLFAIDSDVSHALSAAAPLLNPTLDPILDDFYLHMDGFDETKATLDAHSLGHLKQAHRKHWQTLFSGSFDADYTERAYRVGQVHARIGLKPTWYIGGYAFVLTRLIDVVLARHRRSPHTAATTLRALIKAVMLDVDLAISAYITAGDEKRREQTLTISDQVETEVQSGVAAVADLEKHLDDAATRMCESITVLSSEAERVSAAANETSLNVEIIAAASHELTTSVSEIGRQVVWAQETSQTAAREIATATVAISKLAAAAEEISQIGKLISSIAAQTNLLALNAKIEAARVGQAGRGFAVVAEEVKVLATRSSQATVDITSQVEAIQARTANAVAAMNRIVAVMDDVGQTSTAIAAAIEQQTAATSEISRNVACAATGTRDVSHHITKLANEVLSNRDLATAVRAVSEKANDSIAELEQRVGGLISNLRTSDIREPSAHDNAAMPSNPLRFNGSSQSLPLSSGATTAANLIH